MCNIKFEFIVTVITNYNYHDIIIVCKAISQSLSFSHMVVEAKLVSLSYLDEDYI